MPIYEYECAEHGRFELIQPLSAADDCGTICGKCGDFCFRVPSLVRMQPDPYWAGHVDRDYGYVTSASQVAREMKTRHHVTIGDRTDREGMAKVAADARQAKEDQFKKRMRAWAEKAFGPKGLGLGGADGKKILDAEKASS